MNKQEIDRDIKRLTNGERVKILLTVSGGADSVAMLDLFACLDYPVAAAHCNFNLRAEESDRDERYVRSLCDNYGIELFVKSFDTLKYAEEKSLSIEMAARDLRYGWFESLAEQEGCKYIAVAHHAGDSAETVFINMLRGTGIRGVCGIAEKNGKVIRPLLNYTREEILEYLESRGIDYCEDSTNKETDYIRNKIRHNIIPVLEKINPSFLKTMLENTSHLRDVCELFEQKTEEIKAQITSCNDDTLSIDLKRLAKQKGAKTILFEILKDYGFGTRTTNDIYNSIHSISGKQFFSDTHKLVKDRDCLLVYPWKDRKDIAVYAINENVSSVDVPLRMKLDKIKVEDFEIPRDNNTAFFDLSKLSFPLIIRKWQQGDIFYPFGMNGKKKKVSDYFTDNKFSIKDKEDCLILESDGKILWIVGSRTDERFKVSSETTDILRISLS